MKKILFIITLVFTIVSTNLYAASYLDKINILVNDLVSEVEKIETARFATVDFLDLQGNVNELGRFISDELSSSFASRNNKKYKVIDRLHINNLMKELNLNVSGLLNPKNSKQIGKMAGIDYIVIGTINPMGDEIRIRAKIINVETAETITSKAIFIAKTKAILDLLDREIIVSTSVSSSNKSSYSDPSESIKRKSKYHYSNDYLLISVNSLVLNKKSKKLILSLRATNKTDKKLKLSILGGSEQKAISDNNGNIWEIDSRVIGLTTTNYAHRDGTQFTPKQATNIILSFKPKEKDIEDIEVGTIFTFSANVMGNYTKDINTPFSIGIDPIFLSKS